MLKKIKVIRSISMVPMAMSLTYTHNLEEKDINNKEAHVKNY